MKYKTLAELDAAVERGAAALHALALAQGAAANRYPLDSSIDRERIARVVLEAACTATDSPSSVGLTADETGGQGAGGGSVAPEPPIATEEGQP